MIKISLCMIVKNEDEVLARCLDSLHSLADEIILVDTGSTDKTTEIARRYTEKIFSFRWQDDFAAARNFAFEQATGDYLLWLDADDVLSSANDTDALIRLLDDEQPDVVICPYDVAFDRTGAPSSTFERERFLKRSAGFRWQGRVHECIAPHGKILRFPFHILHRGSSKARGDRNLRIYQKWAAEEPLRGRDLFYYGRELYYNKLYTEGIAVLTEMLQGDGWYVNRIEACKILSLCYLRRGDSEKALCALLQSFCYGEPRASVVCEIAALFKKEKRWKEAAFWYETALSCRDHTEEGDFESPSCRGITPMLELCCCYYALGEIPKALQWHKKAAETSPEHPSVRFNAAFFRKKALL